MCGCILSIFLLNVQLTLIPVVKLLSTGAEELKLTSELKVLIATCLAVHGVVSIDFVFTFCRA